MELLVAISLFIVVFTISIGALLSIFDANKRAQSSKTVVDNLNLSIENMTRTARFGDHYHCDSGSGTITNPPTPQNCSTGGTRIAVLFQGNTVIYSWNGTVNDPIQRSDNGGSPTNITSPDTHISYLKFYVFGSTAADNAQPYIMVVIKGYVGDKPTTQSSFSIQTLMSERTLDM